jgi:hypothetical protein
MSADNAQVPKKGFIAFQSGENLFEKEAKEKDQYKINDIIGLKLYISNAVYNLDQINNLFLIEEYCPEFGYSNFLLTLNFAQITEFSFTPKSDEQQTPRKLKSPKDNKSAVINVALQNQKDILLIKFNRVLSSVNLRIKIELDGDAREVLLRNVNTVQSLLSNSNYIKKSSDIYMLLELNKAILTFDLKNFLNNRAGSIETIGISFSTDVMNRIFKKLIQPGNSGGFPEFLIKCLETEQDDQDLCKLRFDLITQYYNKEEVKLMLKDDSIESFLETFPYILIDNLHQRLSVKNSSLINKLISIDSINISKKICREINALNYKQFFEQESQIIKNEYEDQDEKEEDVVRRMEYIITKKYKKSQTYSDLSKRCEGLRNYFFIGELEDYSIPKVHLKTSFYDERYDIILDILKNK